MDASVKSGGEPSARAFGDSDPSVESAAGHKSPGHGPTSSSLGMAQPHWACGLERTTAVETKRPLRLLDLPVDILRDIIGQLPHANDLTSLALCHSILHSLAIPCIYSRFDIVWPDQGMQTESRAGVDALTYGLATLVKAQEIFGEAAYQRTRAVQPAEQLAVPAPYRLRRRRLGNCYAQHTKKFSLGNGPADCVREYLITKEGGKMLGTLVALAVARMPNLETFTWDMPTGVLRDVWLALSSLADRDDSQCRLENVWIRWHNNWTPDPTEVPPPAPPGHAADNANIGTQHTAQQGHGATHATSSGAATLPIVDRVEHPTFSVLPPLKSLTALEIDELVYLDEMSILIARSQFCLKELRVGIARHAQSMDWTANWEGPAVYQVDHSTTWTIASQIGEKRHHGVLGVLVGRMFNLRNNAETAKLERARDMLRSVLDGNTDELSAESPVESLVGSSALESPPAAQSGRDSEPETVPSDANRRLSTTTKTIAIRPSRPLRGDDNKNGPYLNGILKLETLKLERVPLSIPVLRRAFDWQTLTCLTLLRCHGHDRLWKFLKSHFKPVAEFDAGRSKSTQYCLNIKKIHTNTVSMALLAFIRETLAPNSLETLFLQEAWRSPVGINAIFNCAIRRHRGSLKCLLIDSGDDHLGDGILEPNVNRWRKWKLTRRIVAYLTSGKMHKLRELAVSLDYADWHIFLQRLPKICRLRSLYIPHIADHPHGSNFDTHELAQQIVDIVTLRPEIELCYMGLGTKCFEILENRAGHSNAPSALYQAGYSSGMDNLDDDNDDEDDEDDEAGDDEDVTDDDEDDFDDFSSISNESSDGSADDEWDSPAGPAKTPKLRLQEILFYDKVSIFKARHGRM